MLSIYYIHVGIGCIFPKRYSIIQEQFILVHILKCKSYYIIWRIIYGTISIVFTSLKQYFRTIEYKFV